MHDDTVTTSWRRLTDKINTLGFDSVEDALAESVRAGLGKTGCGAVTLEKLPSAPASMRPESTTLEGGAARSALPAHAAAAGCRTDRDREEIRQAAKLARWEDEGGSTSS